MSSKMGFMLLAEKDDDAAAAAATAGGEGGGGAEERFAMTGDADRFVGGRGGEIDLGVDCEGYEGVEVEGKEELSLPLKEGTMLMGAE